MTLNRLVMRNALALPLVINLSEQGLQPFCNYL